ncbi:sulfate transporter [bacterium (Candidatus Blackallbacteria) CG17_big_fil_post_rev_8_21_14_2_50_48_46]|uniref:Sulfate transporter n=1 Tax=bacterium (Candidatus Blackallbacteria) CG17_big_fil_post_rev_8_21_14_2_50_48_46 TaxID=2014261 RepID=A0A2M7G315_9BACT|nr:MAG: sulfate transporter [bacterium (Candidatus Blackallbacteria) CG18_big_fil_WC_8_21_14_2_50_49_26]PIW16049.1 MAG: sulfate transporter [bacterium (Candidatus Blackallbacteria) CG17_big_fil_post_rev_8_21_14_2_50_48_46]PIW50461.1 MAG: sulfate transporter [bacterium (Candidatus Blackallbacteria) CG13_big_fil_rev_8_21_14_2_50_49_14]
MSVLPQPTLPKDGLAGLKENLRFDLSSGFQIFLIALPLSLGIALASGMPPMAGIISAIVGGLVVSMISGSYVTINGPAAGLIVIIVGGVETLGQGNMALGYRLTLAAIVVAGIIQMAFGLLKAGKLSAYFPAPAVHGMLAAIGIIIMAKQAHTVLGVKPHTKETLEVIAEIPHSLMHANGEIAIIGLICLAVTVLWAFMPIQALKKIPGPLVVVLVGIVLGHVFHLDKTHMSTLWGHEHEIGPQYLINLPGSVVKGIVFPDFSHFATGAFWTVVISIALIASLESLLSALAVDKLDVYGRRANLNKDIFAVGVGSTISGLLGGLPMIAEIVRSSANINNGARTRWANFFHGGFMLLFVAAAPGLIHQIPLASLAALLVFTGFRLASPKEFIHTYKTGPEQLAIFVTTIVCVLATDLLIGVACGIILKLIIHAYRGVAFKDLFKLQFHVHETEAGHYLVTVESSAVFSNLIGLKSELESLPAGKTVIFDFSKSYLIDHSFMEYVHHYAKDYKREGGICEINGLDQHKSISEHPLASRKREVLPV